MGHHNKCYRYGKASNAKGRGDFTNCHHMLWRRTEWSEYYAHKLRELSGFKVYIPANTLHKVIHEKMGGIPCPNEVICRIVYDEVVRDLALGAVAEEWDSLPFRLEYLAGKFEELAPRTAKAIRQEKLIIERWRKENR